MHDQLIAHREETQVKKKRMELAREIIARLKAEMNKRRLAEPSRNGTEAETVAKGPAGRLARE
jgi:hypothetical protein